MIYHKLVGLEGENMVWGELPPHECGPECLQMSIGALDSNNKIHPLTNQNSIHPHLLYPLLASLRNHPSPVIEFQLFLISTEDIFLRKPSPLAIIWLGNPHYDSPYKLPWIHITRGVYECLYIGSPTRASPND